MALLSTLAPSVGILDRDIRVFPQIWSDCPQMRTNIGVFKINLQYNLKVPDLSHLGTLPNFGFKSHHPAFWVSTVELEGRRHDDLVPHGQTDDQTDQEGESSGRLRHGPHIGHGVYVPGGGEHTEVQGGGREAGPDAHVEETQEHEECHVLQVIQVASVNIRLGCQI